MRHLLDRPIGDAAARTRRRRSRRTRVVTIAAVSCTALVGSVATSADSLAVAEPASAPPAAGGYSSAERAADAYVDALAAGDLGGAMAAFAIEPYVERFDFRQHLLRLRAYHSVGQALPLPNTDPFNVAINVEHRRSVVAAMILNQYFTLIDPEFERHILQPLPDDTAVDEFAEAFATTMTSTSLGDLAAREYVALSEVDAAVAETYASDRAREHDEGMLAITGADESAELAVRSSIDGREVTMLFRAVRYGDGWWLESLGGQFAVLLGISASAAGTVVTGSEPVPGSATSPDD
jgi:hypothetical protein